MDWYFIKFLESPTNLKAIVKECIGKTPNTTVATSISTCLQQGRLFFETARSSPLEIKPLQIFYGVLNLSRALAAARNVKPTNSLAQTHGLKDISESNSLIENLNVSIASRGTFQDFNDTICILDSINYFGEQKDRLKIFKETCNSSAMDGTVISLKEILSRVPSLSEAYENTFGEDANILRFSLNHNDAGGIVDLRIDLPHPLDDRDGLKAFVGELRNKYSFLNQWQLYSAERCWGNLILHFNNCEFDNAVEFNETELIYNNDRFVQRIHCGGGIIPFDVLLPPLSGGVIDTHQTYIAPINGNDVSEYAILYMGTFLLSSLVRYRPEIWVHSINGRITEKRGHDDRCMALIESFLDHILNSFPQFVAKSLEVKLS